MRFNDVSVNQSVPTEANRGLTSYSCPNADQRDDAESIGDYYANTAFCMSQICNNAGKTRDPNMA
jgi:hypothetical protein